MKILVVGTGGSIVSGISAAADEMAATVARFGHSVERLNAGSQMRRRSNTINPENVRAVLADAVAVFRRARGGRADAVWIHTFGVPTLPALRALAMVAGARLAGRPAVLQFHAHGLEQAITDGGRSLRVAVRSVTALANATVVLHEAAAGALRSTGGGSPIHVVPNWVEVPDRPGDLPPQPPLRVVFVGGLVRRKGVPLLLEAVRSLKGVPVTLTLVGGAAEDRPEALDRLYAEADDLVSAGRVRFTGELDAAGVRAELRAAHLFVLPSEAEGMPMALLEAMAEGRAVLVSDAGNMRSVVEKAACGWVLPDRRPATIAACIRRIAEGPAGLATASAAAWEAAREGYSAEARHTQIDAILVSLRTPPDRRSEASG